MMMMMMRGTTQLKGFHVCAKSFIAVLQCVTTVKEEEEEEEDGEVEGLYIKKSDQKRLQHGAEVEAAC